jgi:hypothetical protein
MNSDLPIACSLNADELPQRLAEIGAIGRAALRSVEPDGVLRFGADPSTRDRLEAVIAAESECCRFLTFHLREDGGELLLSIRGPDEAEPVIRELIDTFTGAP